MYLLNYVMVSRLSTQFPSILADELVFDTFNTTLCQSPWSLEEVCAYVHDNHIMPNKVASGL
jgi:hypothetical protein